MKKTLLVGQKYENYHIFYYLKIEGNVNSSG